MPRTFSLLLSALLFLAACGGSPHGRDRTALRLNSPGGGSTIIQAEIARTSGEQQRGLMGRTSLKANEGMLFVFPASSVYSFWMKNTLIPLDVLFFNDQGAFVSMATMEPCGKPPEGGEEACPLYPSQIPIRFALEVPAGFVASHRIGEGWRLVLGEWAK